jgi:hypothetical protein
MILKMKRENTEKRKVTCECVERLEVMQPQAKGCLEPPAAE